MIGSPSGVAWALEFKSLLEQFRVPFLCSGGTLLGIIRDQSLIEWDDDLDFLVPRAWLLSEGFREIRDAHVSTGAKATAKGYPLFPSVSFFSEDFKATLSSFLETPKRNLRPIYSIPRTMLGSEDFRRPVWVLAHGTNWPVPKESATILEHLYGNWEIPSRWDGESFYTENYLNSRLKRRALNALNKTLGFASTRNGVWEPSSELPGFHPMPGVKRI